MVSLTVWLSSSGLSDINEKPYPESPVADSPTTKRADGTSLTTSAMAFSTSDLLGRSLRGLSRMFKVAVFSLPAEALRLSPPDVAEPAEINTELTPST